MCAREILGERHTPPAVGGSQALLFPVGAARVECERVRTIARAEKDRAGVLDETPGGALIVTSFVWKLM